MTDEKRYTYEEWVERLHAREYGIFSTKPTIIKEAMGWKGLILAVSPLIGFLFGALSLTGIVATAKAVVEACSK